MRRSRYRDIVKAFTLAPTLAKKLRILLSALNGFNTIKILILDMYNFFSINTLQI
ncbi:MAG: hypothetical protein ACI358_08235 [Candidatus Limimorpha sp.]